MVFNFGRYIKSNPDKIVFILIIVNFLIRILIYSSAKIFYFSDFGTYLKEIENIGSNGNYYFLKDNYLLGISYLGAFAKNILGNLDYFFVLNCFLASITGLIIYRILIILTSMPKAGIIALAISTFYTEYMVFSTVFYSQVIMIFLLSLFILLLFQFLNEGILIRQVVLAVGLILVFLLSFFFKLEFKYIPCFLLFGALIPFRLNKIYSMRLAILSFILIISFFIFNKSQIVSSPPGSIVSNAFVFFGHTDYGGDGGEGSFVYPGNRTRYEAAFIEYCKVNNIFKPEQSDYNSFHQKEIIDYITQNPIKWVNLQFTKFFRTFGVVPETTSFKVLYTGLLNGNVWLTSIVVVAPVALIILLFILFFNHSAIVLLIKGSTAQRLNGTMALQPDDITTQEFAGSQLPITDHRSPITDYHDSNKTGFLYIYLLLFVYFIIATIFFGQYQERYRLPLMVIFIIPALGFFIASFNKDQFLKKSSLIIKGAVIVLFLTIWTFQAKKAIANQQRFQNAIESVQNKR